MRSTLHLASKEIEKSESVVQIMHRLSFFFCSYCLQYHTVIPTYRWSSLFHCVYGMEEI